MAPNPSAALRVLLASVFAAGLASQCAFAETIPPTVDEPGSGFIVLKVGNVVPTYGSVMIRTAQLKDMKPGQEREVDALFPKQMNNLGRANVFGFSIPYSANHYQVIADAEKVTVKMTGSASAPKWSLARKGAWLKGTGDAVAEFRACIPNGDERCFEAIRGVARRFDVVATRVAAPPAPAPAPAPGPRPAPPAPAPAPAPGTLAFPWRIVPGSASGRASLGHHYSCKKEECACATPEACKNKAIALYNMDSKKVSGAEGDKTLDLVAKADAGYYLTVGKDSKMHVCYAKGGQAGDTAASSYSFDPKDGWLPDDLLLVKGEALTRDFKGVKAIKVNWTGTAPISAQGDEHCKVSPESPPPASDPLAGKLKDLLGDDKGALALARLAQKVWTGTPTFDETLAAALKNPDKAKGRAEFLAKAQEQALADISRSAGVLKDDTGLKTDFKEAYCKPAGGPAPAAAPTAKDAMAQAQRQQKDQNTADGRSMPTVAAGAGSPFAGLCSLLDDTPASQPPTTGPGSRVPDIGNGEPARTPDKEPPNSAAEDAKKKKDLQRMAIGGAGGAIVLGVFGFIFGGPIGALAMGAIGFGLMAGVTYLNNNPIDK